MSEFDIIKTEDIQKRIYTVRGIQVMLDRDLAVFYAVKPIRLREQVKRNINRFPADFMFQLTDEETEIMVSQNAIPSKQHLGGALPYMFTEQGVAAISSVLTSERAVEVSIQIIRAFVAMRNFIANNGQLFQRIDQVERKLLKHEIKTEEKFEQIISALASKDLKPRQGIFFDGQVFDAYQFVSDLFRTAAKSIIIIDNYIDDTVLTHLGKRNKNVKVTIFTKAFSRQLALDIKKFNEQYQPVEVNEFNKSHDRFLIIDDKTVYHFGASLKDLGKKWFAFSMFDKEAINILSKLPGGNI